MLGKSRFFHQLADLQKSDFFFPEQRHSLFIGSVGGTGIQSAHPQGVHANPQTGKRLQIRTVKGQLPVIRQRKRLHPAGHPVRIGHRILNGNLHIWHSQLGNAGAIRIFNHRMNHAFPVDYHLNGIYRFLEQPAGLNNLQTLVHQCGRINGQLGAHHPIGMTQCLFHRHLLQLFPLLSEKRPAGSCQNDFMQRILFRIPL